MTKKSKSPAFSFYAGDWLGSLTIAEMTPEQEGAYVRLLCYCWGDPDCSIPDNDTWLAWASRLGERWQFASVLLRTCFAPHPDRPGRIYNERLYKERKIQLERSAAGRSGGKSSGESRSKTSSKSEAKGQANHQANGQAKRKLSSSSSSSSSDPYTSSATSSSSQGIASPETPAEFPNGNSCPPAPDDSSSERLTASILEVFDHYRTYHPRAHPKPRSDSGEWKKIRERLRDGYTVEQLCLAIDGNHRNPFHCGENDKGVKYHGLMTIFRESGQVPFFLEVLEKGNDPVLSEKTKRAKRAMDSVLRRFDDADKRMAGGSEFEDSSTGGELSDGSG